MVVEIKTQRLLLRPLSMEDLDVVHEYASNQETTKYMINLPNKTLEETRAFLRGVSEEWKKDQPNFYEFAVVLDHQQIGAISLYLSEDYKEGELGWILNKNYWGNGYTTEAALALKDYAMGTLGITRLIAHCDISNIGSYRVMEKIGLNLERSDGIRKNKSATQETQELMYALNIKEEVCKWLQRN